MQRSRTELIAENALLRQQLIVLNRQVKHPVWCKKPNHGYKPEKKAVFGNRG